MGSFHRSKEMKNLLIVALLVIVSASSAKAQVEVKMDTEGPVPIVTVWHPGFTQMCRNLAQKLEAPEGTEAIRFQPKSLPPSRARYLGDVWVASIDRTDKKIEVPATELPEVLHRVRGEVVKTIFSARCGLKDSYFYSTEDGVRHDQSIGRRAPSQIDSLTRHRSQAVGTCSQRPEIFIYSSDSLGIGF